MNETKHLIRVGINISELKSSVENAKNIIDGLSKNGQPPKELITSFNKMSKVLDKMSAQTKDGIFKGTDAEYSKLIKELSDVGEEFESIKNTIVGISKLDDDALSKFLTKEDLQNYKKVTKALKDYQSLVKKIQTDGSSQLAAAKQKQARAIRNKQDAEATLAVRSKEVEEKKSAISFDVTKKRETTNAAKQKLDESQERLKLATTNEKAKRAEVGAIDSEIKSLDAQIKKEESSLSEELQELKNAKANFTKIKKFYETPDENGEIKDRSKDYGGKSYKQAEERLKLAESRVSLLNDLKDKKQEKLEEKEIATGNYAKAKKEVSDLTLAIQENEKAHLEAVEAQKKAEEANKTQIEELEKAEEAQKKAQIQVDKSAQAVKDANAIVASTETQEETNKLQEMALAYETLYNEAQELGINLKELGITEEYSEESAIKLTEALQKQNKKLIDGIRISSDAERQLEKTEEELEKNRREIEANAEAQKELNRVASETEAFQNRIKSFLGLSGAAQLLRRALRDALSTIKELDATMTEMAVVTDLSVGDYWDQLPEYSKQASELGVSINSAYEAATLYYQQGLKGNEVTKISAQTLKMAKIAGLSAKDATDKMTAALRGFNMELNEISAQKIADVYSELAAITAANADEISSAMSKTASIAHSAGMEFETTAAFLSQIIETTRESAETAGTALKTVIARFQELKKDPSEIGEVDGEIVDANKIETALRSVGVALRDSSGQFRDLDDVFMELSQKWSILDTNTQRYIATIAAGSRQQSRFIAMMSDYARTQELVAAANNSAGASQRQFEKTMDSLEFKLEELKNAWKTFTMGIMNSDLVKAGIDILTKFLEVINKITGAFKGLGGSLLKIGSVIGIFKLGQAIFEKFKPMLSNFLTSVQKDFEKAGYNSGFGFTKKVQEGRDAALQGANLSTGGIVSPTPQTTGKVPISGRGGAKGLAERAGAGVMNFAGVGHFSDAGLIQEQKKKIRQKIDNAQNIVGTTEQGKKWAADKYEKNKTKLDAYKKDYTILKNGQVTKKGTKDFLPKEEADRIKKDLQEITKYTEDYEKAQEDIAQGSEELSKASQQQWNSISSGLSQASIAAAGVSIAFGAIGQAFSDAGFEEAGNVISGIGTAFMVLSTVMQVASGAISLLAPAFSAAGAAGTASGVATTASWSVVSLVVLAVLAGILVTIGIVLLVLNAIKKASPEEKLKKAQKAADEAAESAGKAAEEYEHLNSALEELNNKYKTLDELTRGTKEWDAAVKDINDSVLNLIDEYPELAKFVENKKGVLTLDVDSAGVQEVLTKAENTKINASNTATALKINTDQKKLDNDFAKLNGVEAVANQRGWQTAGNWMVGGVAGGAAGGAALSLATGPFAPMVAGPLALLGAAAGLVVGGIGAAIAGPISAASAKTDEKLQDATEKLALSVEEGATEANFEDIFSFLTAEGVAEDEARAMAKAFAEDSSALKEFGEGLKEANKASEAYYEAMAMQAEQLANTANWTEEEIIQGQNLIDDDVYKAMEKQAESAVGKLDVKNTDNKNGKTGLKNMNEEQKRLLDEAIKQIYGQNAKRNGTQVTFVNADNQTITENLGNRETEILEAMKQIKATELTTAAMEGTKSVIATLNTQMGGDVASRLYNDTSGGSLTMTDVKNLAGDDNKLSNEEIKEYWNKLNDKEKQVYGNSFSIFAEDFSGIEKAAEAIVDVKEKLEKLGVSDVDKIIDDSVTKDAAIAMGKQFETIAETLASQNLDASAITKEGGIADQYKEIYATVNDKLKDDLSIQFASLDTSTIESLNKFQWELVNVYGIEEKQASSLVESIKNATQATSSWETTIDRFGGLENVVESINKLVNKMTSLQWEYNLALESGSGKLKELISDQVDNLTEQSDKNKEAYADSQRNLAIEYARGATASSNSKVDFREYVTMNEDGSYEVNQAKVQEDAEAGIVNFDEFSDWLDSLEDAYDTMLEHEQAAREAYDSLIELEKQTKEAYYDLRDMAKEAVLDKIQKQIDLQSQLLEATEEANAKIINKIQEQIDDTRQIRENEKAEENIANLRSQAAYLAMDTSGLNSLAILQKEESLAQAEESYQDSLIDQAIQQLEDANSEAIEQRERQISLAEKQLEAYQNSVQFQQHIDSLMTEATSSSSVTNTTLGELLSEAQTGGMSEQEKEDWATQLQTLTDQAAMYTKIDWEEKQAEAYANVTNIQKDVNVMLESMKAKTANQLKNIQQQGFGSALSYEEFASDKGKTYGGGTGASYGAYESYLDKFNTFMNDEGNTKTDEANSQQEEMTKDGYTGTSDRGVMTQSEYNESVASQVAAGENVLSYSEYIANEYEGYKNYLKGKHNNKIDSGGKSGWFPVKFPGWNDFQEGNNEGRLDMDGAGAITPYVGFGSLVSGAKAEFLKQLMKDTYVANETGNPLNDVTAETPTGHAQGIYYDGKAYAYFNGAIREIVAEEGLKNKSINITKDSNEANKKFAEALERRTYKRVQYKTGGLADFTGPAWLDGTKSKPEIVLNQRDSANFIVLRDVLSEILQGTSSVGKNIANQTNTGDNHFEIEINVEKLENDYDVEQLADKIRRMIYDDATYRNVNVIRSY